MAIGVGIWTFDHRADKFLTADDKVAGKRQNDSYSRDFRWKISEQPLTHVVELGVYI